MNKILKLYVKERDEMLKKCSVEEYRKFVNKNKDFFDVEFIQNFNKASDEILEISLHKMIVNATRLPAELKKKSAVWLVTRGYDLNVFPRCETTENLLSKFNACTRAEYTHIENDASFAINREGDKLTLYFEQSNGLTDWRNNFNFPAKPYRKMKNLWFCHRGFLKVWKSIEPHVTKDICDLTVNKIDIIGYSHGGAIAQLCYEYVKFNRPDVEVSGVGFGSPRVLWGFAGKTVKSRFKGFRVIRNGNDLVTHLPPVFFGFRHVCEVVKVGKSEGLIKDHYPSRYRNALKQITGEVNNI